MKENFDDIIRRRWEEREFAVDPAHREEMAKILQGEKRRRGFIFWWFGGLAIVASIGYLIWVNSGSSPLPLAKDQAETLPAVNAAVPPAENEIANISENSKANTASPISEPKETSTIQSIIPSPNQKSNTVSHTNSKVSSNSSAHAPPSPSIDQLKQRAEVNNPMTLKADETKPPIPEPALNESKEKADPYFKVELENPTEVRIVSDPATIRVFPDSIEYDPWTNAIYHNGTTRSLNITKPLEGLAFGKVESGYHHLPGKITPHTKMKHPVYFIGEAGLGFVLASKPDYDGGKKFNVGAGLGMRLLPRIHLQLTGGYQLQDGGFDFERTSTVNRPDFGVRSEFNTLQPERLHYVYGKLGMAYRIKRSSLFAHFGVQKLYGAQGNITIIAHDQFNPVDQESTRYAWLKTDGLRKWHWFSDVSYGYMILPKLYLQGGVAFYYSSLSDTSLPQNDYYWKGKTAALQPFITLNYLLYATF